MVSYNIFIQKFDAMKMKYGIFHKKKFDWKIDK